MKEKNIAVEILKKLMAEQISLYRRTNVVQSQKFSERIAQLMNSYYNGLITNEEVIKELLKTAEEIANFYKNGQKLGLSLDAALDFFYHSEVYQLIREGVSDMHCMSDAYLAEELKQEYEEKVPEKAVVKERIK